MDSFFDFLLPIPWMQPWMNYAVDSKQYKCQLDRIHNVTYACSSISENGEKFIMVNY
jgi:hypothetical protein